MSDDTPDYLKETLFDYKQRPRTNEYAEGWERIFGKKKGKKKEKIEEDILDPDEYFETKYKWNSKKKYNACIYCGRERKIKYIATGHDHTDYSYDVCNCDGASAHGKPWKDLN